jgi:hypothetical protein
MFAALEIATGKVTGLCKNRHRHQEFLAFLKHLARTYPDGQLQLVMDNHAAHKRVEIRSWPEIEQALRSMQAFVAIVNPEFNVSVWCHQETGWVLARRVPS